MKKEFPRNPIEGVEVWKNPKNKFLVFQLHYSANPIKRDPKYRDTIKSAMPIAQYMQEYELEWESYSGYPVYRDFSPKMHLTKSGERIEPHIGLPLLIGFDFGLTPAAVICQLQGERLVVLQEYVETNMGAERFLEMIMPKIRLRFPEWSQTRNKNFWRCYIDPAGFQKAQSNETKCAEYVGKHFVPFPGEITWEARRRSVEHFLTKHNKEGPCFIVNRDDCPTITRGFGGGYRYPESAFDVHPKDARPIKDEHSHPHDALQYVCSKLVTLKRSGENPIPAPSYSWSQGQGR